MAYKDDFRIHSIFYKHMANLALKCFNFQKIKHVANKAFQGKKLKKAHLRP